MNTLCFKSWLEDMNAANSMNQSQELAKDPALAAANKAAQSAAKNAVLKKQDPLQAAKMAVLNSNLPANKLGSVLPKDPSDKSVVA
jgi:hypothetical protein